MAELEFDREKFDVLVEDAFQNLHSFLTARGDNIQALPCRLNGKLCALIAFRKSISIEGEYEVENFLPLFISINSDIELELELIPRTPSETADRIMPEFSEPSAGTA